MKFTYSLKVQATKQRLVFRTINLGKLLLIWPNSNIFPSKTLPFGGNRSCELPFRVPGSFKVFQELFSLGLFVWWSKQVRNPNRYFDESHVMIETWRCSFHGRNRATKITPQAKRNCKKKVSSEPKWVSHKKRIQFHEMFQVFSNEYNRNYNLQNIHSYLQRYAKLYPFFWVDFSMGKFCRDHSLPVGNSPK